MPMHGKLRCHSLPRAAERKASAVSARPIHTPSWIEVKVEKYVYPEAVEVHRVVKRRGSGILWTIASQTALRMSASLMCRSPARYSPTAPRLGVLVLWAPQGHRAAGRVR
jgi:hypothetical protein